MERLEISQAPRAPWYWTIAGLGLFVYLIAGISEKVPALAGFQALVAWALLIAMALLGLRFLASVFEETSSYLVASHPPTLTTTRTWFGKLTTTKHQAIERAAWVRVNYVDDMLLAVEVGTYGHQTTTIHCIPYSESNIPAAKASCTAIAQFLKLEDKGYRVYG